MTTTVETGIVGLSVASLVAHNYREASPEAVRDLSRAIEADGLVRDPIDVVRLFGLTTQQWDIGGARYIADIPESRFQIVSGHHRVGAVKLLGWETIPARILAMAPDSAECLLTAVSANLTHHASRPTEDAQAFARLIEAGMTVADIALRIAQPASYVERRLSIMAIDPVCRYIADKHGFAWCEALVELDWSDQRDLVRALETTPMNREQWAELTRRARARREEIDQDSMFGGDFGLTSQEWDTDLARYAADIVVSDATIEAMRRPLGKADIADLLGYPRKTVHTWSDRGLLPPPAGTLSSAPYWWDQDILTWAEATGRAGRRPAETIEE